MDGLDPTRADAFAALCEALLPPLGPEEPGAAARGLSAELAARGPGPRPPHPRARCSN